MRRHTYFNCMKNNKGFGEKLIFVLFYLFSMFSMHSDNLSSYWGNNGTPFMFFRFILIIILMVITTVINNNNAEFIIKFVPSSTLIITGMLMFDYYVTKFSGSQFLYSAIWIAYIIISLMTVFITYTLVIKDDYVRFYTKFWRAFIPLYVFVFVICFLRKPGESYELNLQLGQGTFLMLKALVNDINVSFIAPLMFFGNIMIFVPLPFMLSSISKKLTPPIIMIIGFITPFLVEAYQLIFRCGQVDIDDIVLNFGGFMIAFMVYLIVYKKRLKDTVN